MEPLVLEHGDVRLRVDHGLFEVFRRGRTTGSYRAPSSWLKVRSAARKSGVTRLHFGNIAHIDEPLYAPETQPGQLLATIEIPNTDEPLDRAGRRRRRPPAVPPGGEGEGFVWSYC
ncbi:hypothetical protein AB0P17_27235 [Streptomyces sp. NPDC088124]|uniref:hypothetical protein n=1 Tax=Streptomyces sp. NPDC088124 TaxID=3154654 RepID=UPI00344A4424